MVGCGGRWPASTWTLIGSSLVRSPTRHVAPSKPEASRLQNPPVPSTRIFPRQFPGRRRVQMIPWRELFVRHSHRPPASQSASRLPPDVVASTVFKLVKPVAIRCGSTVDALMVPHPASYSGLRRHHVELFVRRGSGSSRVMGGVPPSQFGHFRCCLQTGSCRLHTLGRISCCRPHRAGGEPRTTI